MFDPTTRGIGVAAGLIQPPASFAHRVGVALQAVPTLGAITAGLSVENPGLLKFIPDAALPPASADDRIMFWPASIIVGATTYLLFHLNFFIPMKEKITA